MGRFFVAAVLVFLSGVVHAETLTVPNSCYKAAGGVPVDMCRCELFNSLGKTRQTGVVDCSLLQCQDYKVGGFGRPKSCDQRPSVVRCVLANPAYSGMCVQDVPADRQGRPATQVCKLVERCLNDASCLVNYCDATFLRTDWKLVNTSFR